MIQPPVSRSADYVRGALSNWEVAMMSSFRRARHALAWEEKLFRERQSETRQAVSA